MTDKLIHIEITDHDSLMEGCGVLHDAFCDLATVEFDQARGIWRAKFEREFWEDPALMHSAPKLFVFTRTSFPIAMCEFTLREVASYEVRDRSRIGRYYFNECVLTKHGYELRFCEDMDMIFKFRDQARGELRDIKLLEKTGSFLSWRNPLRKTPQS